jgi:methylated-DNA-[protein]-cysteine S-methyltransferase
MKEVWRKLQDVPYGHTASYKDIATEVGNPRAVRAVGQANHRNPIPIFIPCHRIIGSNGNLVGYGGGLALKEKLLALEKRYGSI